MLDEQRYDAYAAARSNLGALARSANVDDPAGDRYYDLLTALELAHESEDLSFNGKPAAAPRSELYANAQSALSILHAHASGPARPGSAPVDPLEILLISGNLFEVFNSDVARDGDYDGS